MISVIFGDPRGSLSCSLTNKNGILLWSKRSSDRQGRSFFLFKKEMFYGDTRFVSRKIKGNTFNTSNVGLERVDEEIFGGEYPEVADDYRYIIPDLSGHGEAMSETYVSAAEEARILTQYLLKHGVTKIDLGFAASLGGVVLFEILNRREIKFKRLFFEGVSFCENAKLGGFLMTKIMLAKQKKGLKNPKLAVEKMSKMFGGQAGRVMAERFFNMNPRSIKNIVRDCSNVRLPKMDAEMQRSCVFSYGEYDSDLRLAKKKIPKMYPKAKLVVDEGYGHCEKMVKDAEGYARRVMRVN